MEHGFKCIKFYVKKSYSTSRNVSKSTASSRQAARSARICETRLLQGSCNIGQTSEMSCFLNIFETIWQLSEALGTDEMSRYCSVTQIANFMVPTWGPPGSCRPQMGPCWPHEPCYQERCVSEGYPILQQPPPPPPPKKRPHPHPPHTPFSLIYPVFITILLREYKSYIT